MQNNAKQKNNTIKQNKTNCYILLSFIVFWNKI